MFDKSFEDLATITEYLTTDQVQSLYTIGTFVYLCDARISDDLFHARLFDVPVATEHLLRKHRALETLVAQIGFGDWCEQLRERLAVAIVCIFAPIERQTDEHRKGPTRFRVGPDGQQHPPHVGVYQ